jgi:exopolyphosphatase/guanosine-5'-triphosphate,3'-diphosphate pyrophosphatase
MIRVGIDLGTNTALMVVATVDADGSVQVLDDIHDVPRLGEGLDASGRISAAAIDRAATAFRRFRAIVDARRPDHLRIVATSAMREASNGADVRRHLEEIIGCPIDVIDGNEEARLTFLGSVGTRPQNTLMIDIGGGSTEYAIGAHGSVVDAISTPIGAVRLTERFATERPISASSVHEARAFIREHLGPFAASSGAIDAVVGVAGTPTALAMMDLHLTSFDPEIVEGHRLSRDRVGEMADWLTGLSLDDLRAIPGLHERRADIVPMGAVILHTSLVLFNAPFVDVTVRGLRFGAMLTSTSH